jgi:Sulfotransferase family
MATPSLTAAASSSTTLTTRRRRAWSVLSIWSLVGLGLLMRGNVYHAERFGSFLVVHPSVIIQRPMMRETNNSKSANHEKDDGEGVGNSIYNGTATTYKPPPLDFLQESTMDPSKITQATPFSHVKIKMESNHSTTRVVTAWDQNRNRSRSIAFVHIGKAGGNTVRWALPRLKCRRLRREHDIQRCFQDTYRPESPLAHQVNIELHMNKRLTDQDFRDNNYDTFLFAIRNPITRAISAYQFLHYNNTRSVWAQMQHPLKDVFYKECFPKLQDLLEALEEIDMGTNNSSSSHDPMDTQLSPDNKNNNTRHCQQLAITVLQGRHPALTHINIHLLDNYRYYYQYTIQRNLTKDVLVIRTENLWDDLKELDVAMGGPGVFETEGKVVNKNQNNMYYASSDATSQGNGRQRRRMHNLCCILMDEMILYQEILNRALNLDYNRKLQTIQDVWTLCGIESLQINKFQDHESAVGEMADVGTRAPQPMILFSWSKWGEASCPELMIGKETGTM